MPLVSVDDFAGGAAAPATSKSSLVSPEEFAGSDWKQPGVFSSFGKPVEWPEQGPTIEEPSPRKQSFAESGGGAATGVIRQKGQRLSESTNMPAVMVGTAAAVSDMFTGAVKQVLSPLAYWSARAGAQLEGGTNAEAAKVGAEFVEKVFPPELFEPWAKVAESLGPKAQSAYKNNPFSWVMAGMSSVIDKGVEGTAKASGIPPEDLNALVQQFMGSLLFHQMKPGAQLALETRLGQVKKAVQERTVRKEERAAANFARAEEASARQTAMDNVYAASSEPVYQQINSLLGIRTPAEQAKIDKARQKDVKTSFREPAEGSDYKTGIDESQFTAEERVQRRQDYAAEQARAGEGQDSAYELGSSPKPERVGQAEILRIMQKPGFERTPEDLITLRAARQEGKATPEAIALLGAAGIGAVTGAELDDEALRGAALGGLTAMGFVLPHLGRGPSVPSKMGQGGAVKGPGGMWHPKAVKRLSQPIKNNLTDLGRDALEPYYNKVETLHPDWFERDRHGSTGVPLDDRAHSAAYKLLEEEHPEVKWADKAVRNYLNKYAGTERDPLKDVELPSGRTWAQETDAIINKKAIRDIPQSPEMAAAIREGRLKDSEPVWDAGEHGRSDNYESTQALISVKDYLSHAGDFARQNIPPEKLAQYDLVRLIKETAANDKRVAKEMEKAAAESSKDLPVYKEYPDGMKWVELKLPEKLTKEQSEFIRPATKAEASHIRSANPNYIEGEFADSRAAYVAKDPLGQPIKNAYTQEFAGGRTPEEAYLAGQLAQEGNQMGHCVGGYCEGVASGESKIYSLRDKKGLSHVTVEVAPTGFNQEALDKGLPSQESILQIKGKQNRAPVAEYLPYVQDFVKGGKWGEVGDLGNTGLVDISNFKSLQGNVGHHPRAKELFSQRYVTHEELNELSSGKLSNRESGSIDQQLLMGLGAIGLGGLVGSSLTKDPIDGAILGMIAAGVLGFTKAGRARALDAVEKADYGVGVISTRLSNHAPELGFAIRGLDERVMKLVGDRVEQAIPAMKAVAKLPPKTAEAFDIAAFNGDAAKIAEIAKGNPALVSGLRQLRNVYDAIGKEAVSMNRFKAMLPTYFPRAIKDFPGLKEKIGEIYGTENLGKLELALRNANETAIVSRGAPLSAAEQSVLLNRELQAFKRPDTGHLPGYAKARTIKEITPELLPFYHSFAESAFQHISSATKDLENAKFFGRDLITSKGAGGREFTNVDRSIGNYLGRLIAEGKLDKAAEQEVTSILESRFKGGERSPDWWASQVRGIGHLTLLGNLPSAIVQLGDPFMAFYAHGPQATIASVARQLTGNSRISVKDYHLSDHISQEFLDASRTIPAGKLAQAGLIGGGAVAGMVLADDKLVGALGGAALGFVAAVGTANAVNKAFRTSGFTAIDSFGKNVQLNAALTKYENWAQTKLGQAKIAKKYQRAFEEDFPQLVEDLRTGNITENVRTLLFNELADMQPISKSEMSQLWLDHPNAGRLAMTLKTFMQKQLDIARRDGYNKIKEGNKAEGIRNLTALALTLGISGAAANTIKQFIMGEKVTFGPEDVYENILKTVGLSEYTRDKIRQAPIKAVGSMFVPPIAIMDQIITRDPKAVKAIPIIGKLYYSWELGGKEEVEIREAQKAKKQGKEVDLSERAIEYRTQKREAAREKRERALQ